MGVDYKPHQVVKLVNVLITGGAGYIGSQLIRDLGEDPRFAGSRIVIYDNMQDERYQSLMNLPSSVPYDFHYGDVQDVDELTDAAKDCDVIIHLAALCNAVISFDRVEETEQVNYCGTENVVTAAIRSSRVRRVIYASTCSVYGVTSGCVNEDSECHPESPYGRYKLEGERAVLRLAKTTAGRVHGTGLRLATVFGLSPGLRVHTVVNVFSLHAALGMPLRVFGSGEQHRPFVHVKDASAAFLFALGDERTQDSALNVVGENATVNDVLRYVEQWFPNLKVEREETGRRLNQLSYEVDGSRIRELGWQPTVNVESGVEEFARLCTPFSTTLSEVLVRG